MKIVCPPLYSCWGVVALAACSARIPVCAAMSSSEVLLAQARGGFPSGERSGILSPRFSTLKLRRKKKKKCSVQSSLKDLGFSGAWKDVPRINFYWQNGSYYLEWFRLHLYNTARNCSLESCGKVFIRTWNGSKEVALICAFIMLGL